MPAKAIAQEVAVEAVGLEAWRRDATKIVLLIAGLIAVPCIILIGMGYGICFGVQAGAEAGLKKTSRMLKDWRQ